MEPTSLLSNSIPQLAYILYVADNPCFGLKDHMHRDRVNLILAIVMAFL
jgi:hypothetical protein